MDSPVPAASAGIGVVHAVTSGTYHCEMAQFIPRSIRGTGAEATWTELRPGIPAGLRQPLFEWVRPFFQQKDHLYDHWVPRGDRLGVLGIDLHLDLPGNPLTAFETLIDLMDRDDRVFLSVVDWCLHQCRDAEVPIRLEIMLAKGSSAERVANCNDHFELQDRIDPTIDAAARTAATPGTAAAHHLAEAWSHVYGQDKDYTAGYSNAVVAVECVALPAVIPNDPVGTLGKAINAMDAAPTKWMSSLGEDGIESAIAMMKALWRKQKRHGTTDSTTPIAMTQAEAEAAVHLAATLVHWFDSGAISRVQI
jgi:hypothetical protein